jgi:hypothetical protein
MSGHTFRYAHLVHLSDRDLHQHLLDKGKRPIEIQIIKDAVREAQVAKRSAQAKNKYLDRAWRELIAPLTNEIRSVYSMTSYSKKGYPNKQRAEALEAYDAVLRKLKEKLKRYHKAYDDSPSVKAEKLNLPNEGEHWVDWIPLHIRTAISLAFADIPPSFRARVKTPFVREIPKALNSLRKSKVLQQIQRERIQTEQEAAIMREMTDGEPNEALREIEAHLYQLAVAEHYVLTIPDNVLVPHTWQEALKAEDREIVKPLTRKKC